MTADLKGVVSYFGKFICFLIESRMTIPIPPTYLYGKYGANVQPHVS